MAAVLCYSQAAGQKFLKRVTENALNTTERAVNKKIDKHIEETIADEERGDNNRANLPSDGKKEQTETVNVKGVRKYDFVQGATVLYSEDFRQDETGAFPLKWFTQSSGITDEIEGHEGKWLHMMPGGKYLSPIIALKDNYTIEFDVVADIPQRGYLPAEFEFRLIDNGIGDKAVKDYYFKIQNDFGFTLYPYPAKSQLKMTAYENGRESFRTPVTGVTSYLEKKGKKVHFALQVQGSRLRLWIDEEKVVDAPTVIPTGSKFNQMVFSMSTTSYTVDEIAYYLTNIRLASGMADTRSKLITEGKLSTTGITFANNSDVITPESSGTIKNIAEAMKQVPDMKVMITGHTDNIGQNSSNQLLSEKRAAAVKKALVKDYSIDDSRIQTSGKGASAPVADNNSAAGKAANRRVEFNRI